METTNITDKNFLEAKISTETASMLRAKALVAKCAEEVNEVVSMNEAVRRSFRAIDEVLSDRLTAGINANICKSENVI